MLTRLLPLCALASTLVSGSASAAWVKKTLGAPGFFMTEVTSPNGVDVFVAGMQIAVNGSTVNMTNKVWGSSDGGANFAELAAPWGVQSGFGAAGANALYFIDAQTGWLALGTKIWKTASAGAQWTSATTPFTAHDLHFFDGSRGVAVGEDGAIYTTSNGGAAWTAVTSPATSKLRQMFWSSSQIGYVIGYDDVQIEVPGSEGASTYYTAPDDAVLLKTSDGGAHWTLLESASAMAFSAVWFSADGRTGWLGQWRRTSETEYEMALVKTTDGGNVFNEVVLPTKVGTASFSGFSGDVHVVQLNAIHMAGQRGRIAASAFINEETQSSGGTMSPITTTQKTRNMKHVDYVTSDGGVTWTATQIGNVVISTTAGQTPNDGDVYDAQLWGLSRGWLAAHKNGAWRDDAPCAAQVDCGGGFTCASGICDFSGGPSGCASGCGGDDVCIGGTCVAPTSDCNPACSSGLVCLQGSCFTEDSGSGGSGGEAPNGSATPDGSTEDDGCAAGSPGLTAALAVGLVAMLRRRRR